MIAYLRYNGWFNRTFMELKFKLKPEAEKTVYGFNRTFMELKLKWSFRIKSVRIGLIVPLWN